MKYNCFYPKITNDYLADEFFQFNKAFGLSYADWRTMPISFKNRLVDLENEHRRKAGNKK